MTPSEIKAVMEGIAPVITELVDKSLKPLADRITALEGAKASGMSAREKEDLAKAIGYSIADQVDKQIKAKGSAYRGTWQASEHYVRGNFVSMNGSMFHCAKDCLGERPGASSAWQLAVKRGTDGKDAR